MAGKDSSLLSERIMDANSWESFLNHGREKLAARKGLQTRETHYDEYLMAMKRIYHRQSTSHEVPPEIETPRERRRKLSSSKPPGLDSKDKFSMSDAARMGIIASMVPDEIIYKHSDYSIRSYETALMFCDVSGFTNLCEKYTTFGRGGPSRLTKVLNSYIGAMVQEILTHNGDVLKFSGDAFLSMWKKTEQLSMQDVVHNAIDCGLIIQKNYGTFTTEVGVVLKVKVAISAGMSHFSIIGDESLIQTSSSSYVIVGQPVWDVKMAQYMSKSGDVLTAASAWMYVNEAEYWTQPCGDGRHTKVLGVGASWKRVEKLQEEDKNIADPPKQYNTPYTESGHSLGTWYKEFSLRPAVIAAVQTSWFPGLRRFMATPVLRAVDNEEPMEFLTEVRRVVVVFLNIITRTVTDEALIVLVDGVYKLVSSVTLEAGGLVNKVSMFDKDMMILIVFGLRGLSHEDEAQHALFCAFMLIDKIVDENIINVSIGVTSGTTYCGVVGHELRREYTVIGPAVNKAARLMMTYLGKVTCDKETFLRSKIEHEFFRQIESQPLKGIAEPGPVYEFDYYGWPDRLPGGRHPLLGRNEEVRKFKSALQNALEEQAKPFTRYRDHVYGVAFTGPHNVGKSRLLDECLFATPDIIRKGKIVLIEQEKIPYFLFRKIMVKHFKRGNPRNTKDIQENKIRQAIAMENLTPLQIHGINTIFDCQFPLPENFYYKGDVLSETSVKMIVREICSKVLNQLSLVVVDDAQHMDTESWRLLLILLETKTMFFVLSITNADSLPDMAKTCLQNNMILKIPLSGIDRTYHAALACQLLDVQAIPTDLEKVIESASRGMPGWIHNFVIGLVQRGALTIETLTRSEASKKPGVIMPAKSLLQKPTDFEGDQISRIRSAQSIYSEFVGVAAHRKPGSLVNDEDNETIQMAVMADSYSFEDDQVDMAMDAIILKTYDALSPFEKMLLKCGSVLGDIFSRRMLLSLLQSDCPRKVAEAVAKLFSIRVLECEGGDFTHNTSRVLVHPAPAMPNPIPPYCACLGTRRPHNCRDLPMYAFCGYMKFRHTLFRTTTYDLLTETQKLEMHARALLFLERFTRRCRSCGAGCFVKLLGLRCDDGLIKETEELKKTRLQICALSAEARMSGEDTTYLYDDDSLTIKMAPADLSSYEMLDTEGHLVNLKLANRGGLLAKDLYSKNKRVRSFSSLEMEKCECLAILMSFYSQVIDHCRGAGEFQKLYEAYLEYTDLCININSNIPQAVRLLIEVEDFVQNENFYPKDMNKQWVKDFSMAGVSSLRGLCMLESGDHGEARKQLFQAMQLYNHPFPTSKHKRKLCNWSASFHQKMALYVAPNLYIEKDSGIIGNFYEDIATTLYRLYRLFTEEKEPENATLAAKWCLHFALRTNSNFRLLCASYANMIRDYGHSQQFSACRKLEFRAMEVCRRKRGQLDVTEIPAVCYLYTSIFLFYVDRGKKIESLEFGLSVMHMVTTRTEMNTRETLVLCMLKLLLDDLKIHDMVTIMREFFYLTDHYDLCSETWYYYYAIVVMLDTGYCVESYTACETFYMKKGDALLRTKIPEAAWNFFVSMWLVTIRVGAWERTVGWEEKIKQLMSMKLSTHEFNMMIVIRLVEGLLITLVREMDNKNYKKVMVLKKHLKSLFKDMKKACDKTPIHKSRYCLMYAYYNYISGQKRNAYLYLKKARDLAQKFSQLVLVIWVQHTRDHWKGNLRPKYVDYWCDHVEQDNLLDYRDFDSESSPIVPYTLPLPADLDR